MPVAPRSRRRLAQLEDADRDEFLKDLGLDKASANRVIRAGYKLLGLQTYFTAGEKAGTPGGEEGLDRAAGGRHDPY